MTDKPVILGAVIARDEEKHLATCLDSLRWTDERIVLLDDRTTDGSAAAARELGVEVVPRKFTTFPNQRNAVLELAAERHPNSWLFFVDADERSSQGLAAEIRQVVVDSGETTPVGYWVPRRNYIWGEWIRHGGWSPDYQMRLMRASKARFDAGRDVHELAILNGTEGYLQERLVHYNYDRLDQFLVKQRYYCRLEAQRLRRAGIHAKPQNFVLQPLREFRRRYVDLEGYRDGWRGLTLSVLLAWYAGVTYVDLARAT